MAKMDYVYLVTVTDSLGELEFLSIKNWISIQMDRSKQHHQGSILCGRTRVWYNLGTHVP